MMMQQLEFRILPAQVANTSSTHNENPYLPNWSGGKGGFSKSETKGSWAIAFSTSAAAGIGEEGVKAPRLFLMQNYPNPFIGKTSIKFGLPHVGKVSLKVYNIIGQRVATLIERRMEPGIYTIKWDGRSDTGGSLSAGVYFYVLKYERRILRRKMIMLK